MTTGVMLRLMSTVPEPWLRGPVSGIPPLLQPAAHAFIMAREDVSTAVTGISVEQLWLEPGGAASLGFHLFHLSGSTNRLLTYARAEALSSRQRETLALERSLSSTRPSLEHLLNAWSETVDAALQQLSSTREDQLLEARLVGRAQLPSTTLGLLFHAAEHASRHTGQIVTTAKVLRATRLEA
jgi:uncharacterized damage-inducible protein DinB